MTSRYRRDALSVAHLTGWELRPTSEGQLSNYFAPRPPCGHGLEGTGRTVGLRYEGSSHGFELKLLGSHLMDDLSNGFEREPIKCFPIRSRRHVSRFRLDLLIGKNGQIFCVHEPVEITVFPLSVAVQRP